MDPIVEGTSAMQVGLGDVSSWEAYPAFFNGGYPDRDRIPEPFFYITDDRSRLS